MKKQCLLSMSMMMALSTFSVIPVKAADVDHLLIN